MSQRADNNGVSRRTFLKQTAALSLALSGTGLATTLAACGGEQTGGKAEIQFWDMIWGPPEYIDSAKKLVDQFNQEHPDIQVSYRSVPWNNWYQTFTTAIGSGTAPDVSTGAAYQSVQFYDTGAIAPVDDIIEEWKSNGTLDDFHSNSIDSLKFDNHYVALPWAIDIRVLFYRKDHFEQAGLEPPKTWDELRTVAKKLTGNGKYGLVASSDTGGSHYLFFLMLNNGGGLFTPDRKPNLMDPRNQEALKFFSDLVKDGSISPASAGYQSTDFTKAFGQGDAAMMIDGPGSKSEVPAEFQDKVGIMPPLQGPHGDKGTVSWFNNIMLYQQSQHPAEAKTFLKWWSEKQLPLWTEGHSTQLPVRKSISNDPYFEQDADRNFALQNWVPIGKTTATKAPSIFPELNAIEGEGVMQTLTQDLLQGKDVQQSTQKAQAGMENIMNSSS